MTATAARFLVMCATISLGSGIKALAAEDVGVIVTSGKKISAAERPSGAHIFNRLPTPDISTLVPDTSAGPHAQGVMTKDGAFFNADAAAKAFGSFGIPYTSTRVQEGKSGVSAKNSNRLSTTYPYRAVGKLTFKAGAVSSFCSASLIRRSVIVTTAHCVQSFGSGEAMYTDFKFRPGHYGGSGAVQKPIAPDGNYNAGSSGGAKKRSAPYGTYRAYAIVRPDSWADGTDNGVIPAVDNDIAVIALKKRNDKFAGSRTGYLGYGWNNYGFVSSPKTGNLNTAAVTTLGYPALLDRGRIMQRTDGPVYTTTVEGASQLWQGSDFTGGASGGPWIVNFRSRTPNLSGGATPGAESTMAVIGVTSWGSADPNQPKDQFSSQFGQNSRYPDADYGGFGGGNIGSLLDTLCKLQAPEGGTLKSRGYCN